jgi:hypothetical protein
MNHKLEKLNSTRRDFLKASTGSVLLPGLMGVERAIANPLERSNQDLEQRAVQEFGLTPADEIIEQARRARPLYGGLIPEDLNYRLGATHYDGRYYLTEEPFLLEGCQAVQQFGMNVVKLWLAPRLPGYAYNSEWNLSSDSELVDIARHAYFQAAFEMPFSTFVLEIAPIRGLRSNQQDQDFADDERQLHDLASYLMETYAERDVTFILQHWEGDWMLRQNAGLRWEPGGPTDVQQRCEQFSRWLEARQQGVTRARQDTNAQQVKCKVLHATEVNRVMDLMRGIPTLTSHVLPHVEVDLVSWSCYDGMRNEVDLWRGIELIRKHASPSPAFGDPVVFIGEVGIPEASRTEEEIVNGWDRAMGVFLAQNIPWIVQWELYCNEPKAGDKSDYRVRTAEEMRGFWLIRPDGSLSFGGQYIKKLLEHAGGVLPEEFLLGVKAVTNQ